MTVNPLVKSASVMPLEKTPYPPEPETTKDPVMTLFPPFVLIPLEAVIV